MDATASRALVGTRTNGADADGEIVWSWRPDAGAKLARDDLADDGGKKARFPGEITYKP
jgi:hypothetical protein